MVHATEQDLKKPMVSKAALHVVNEASVRYLTKRVLEQYPEEDHEKLHFDTETFRANFHIDTGKEFEEDEFKEIRCNSVMMRIVGYCSRCKAVSVNY